MSISIPDHLLERVDEAVSMLGFTGRSELVREAVRRMLEAYDASLKARRGIFVIVVLSDHKEYKASDRRILEVIHENQQDIKAFYHQILEGTLCLNIAVVEGYWETIGVLLRDLRGIRGVIGVNFLNITLESLKGEGSS
ncbi:MAG: CopG family ribbon-helix-helix protein [Thermoprotei archaeon]|nr:CopG family ribbon-helix-helix protein [Thermoprotei archaeon]